MKKSLGISFIASLLILSSAVTASAVKFEFDVDASNSRFSKEYEPYYPHITADTSTVEEIYERISSDTIVLTPIQKQTRMAMIEMYKNAGFDISLPYMTGNENYGTSRSIEDLPASWSTKTPKPLNGRYEQCFSIDACWNNKIPLDFPKVEIPKEVFSFSNFMIATVGSKMQPGGNGTGIPVIIGKKDDPKKLLLDKEGMAKIRKLYEFRCPDNVADYLNTNTNSDAHAVFIDDEHKVGIQTWRTSASGSWTSPGLATMQNVPGYDVRSACISNVFRLDGIGADGGRAGVYATQVVTHGFTIKDWEINEPDAVINHAVSGAFNPLCTGWVYPALRSDAGAKNVNPGNVGSIIQGALLRLDPEFDLESVYSTGKLSLPALMITMLQADIN